MALSTKDRREKLWKDLNTHSINDFYGLFCLLIHTEDPNQVEKQFNEIISGTYSSFEVTMESNNFVLILQAIQVGSVQVVQYINPNTSHDMLFIELLLSLKLAPSSFADDDQMMKNETTLLT